MRTGFDRDEGHGRWDVGPYGIGAVRPTLIGATYQAQGRSVRRFVAPTGHRTCAKRHQTHSMKCGAEAKRTLDLPAMGPTSLLDGIPTEDDEAMPTQTSLSFVSAFEGRKQTVFATGSLEGDRSC